MDRFGIQKRFMAVLAAVFICTSILGTSRVLGQMEPPQDIETQLTNIAAEERETLQQLFDLTQELAIMEKTEQQLEEEMKLLDARIAGYKLEIQAEEQHYQNQQEGLAAVMRSYQRLGAGSYLQILLDSDSLAGFLRKLNTLRDFTRNTGKLIAEAEEQKQQLTLDRNSLLEKHRQLEAKKEQQALAVAERLKLKEELEKNLAALADQRGYYQQQLNALEAGLKEIEPMLSQIFGGISDSIKEGRVPENALELSISLFSVKGKVTEKSFNEILALQQALPKLEFHFQQDRLELVFPEKQLKLQGHFEVQEGHTLSFLADSGSFFEMPLQQEYLDKLFQEGTFKVALEPLLGKNTLQSVKLYEGYMELYIKPNLF